LAPLSSHGALTLAQRQIDQAVKGGAKITLAGKHPDDNGFFIEPTILENVSPDNPVHHQEFFAPVAMIFRVKTDDDVVKLANDSPYGWVARS